jgi:hypothetical protein
MVQASAESSPEYEAREGVGKRADADEKRKEEEEDASDDAKLLLLWLWCHGGPPLQSACRSRRPPGTSHLGRGFDRQRCGGAHLAAELIVSVDG